MYKEYPETAIKVPEKCLICGAEYKGGHELPGKPMKLGLRVFYKCGASISVADHLGMGCYMLRTKNCEKTKF